MDVKSVMDARQFSPDKPARIPLFESGKMSCAVVAISPGQEQKPHVHAAAGMEHSVKNDSGANLTLLVVMTAR
jgi:hypothetical protein